jgi:hypothetical protein
MAPRVEPIGHGVRRSIAGRAVLVMAVSFAATLVSTRAALADPVVAAAGDIA